MLLTNVNPQIIFLRTRGLQENTFGNVSFTVILDHFHNRFSITQNIYEKPQEITRKMQRSLDELLAHHSNPQELHPSIGRMCY